MADKKKKKPLASARDLQLIRIVGVLAVVFLFVYFGIMPAISQHGELEEQSKSLQAEVDKCSSAAPTLTLRTQADTNFASVKQTLEGYPTALGSTEIDQLTTVMAADHNVSILSLAISNPNSYAAVPTYTPASADSTSKSGSSSSSNSSKSDSTLTGIYGATIDITFYGDEFNLQRIIDDICSGKYPNVNIVSFAKSSQIVTTSSAGGYTLNLKLTVYSYEDVTAGRTTVAS